MGGRGPDIYTKGQVKREVKQEERFRCFFSEVILIMHFIQNGILTQQMEASQEAFPKKPGSESKRELQKISRNNCLEK